ncbi:hypothetical protein G6F56_001930 [Rhizopus delemar]|nr:hypothetical protein G6F56_001930 [Rhizopus delemar]
MDTNNSTNNITASNNTIPDNSRVDSITVDGTTVNENQEIETIVRTERSKRRPYKKMTSEIWKIFWNNYQLKGYSLYQAAKSINFPESTMHKWVERVGDSREGTIPELSIRRRTAPGLIMANHSQFIKNLVESRSDCTLKEISLLLQEEFPKDFERRLSVSAVHKHLVSKLNFTLKKAKIYSERRNNEEIQ